MECEYPGSRVEREGVESGGRFGNGGKGLADELDRTASKARIRVLRMRMLRAWRRRLEVLLRRWDVRRWEMEGRAEEGLTMGWREKGKKRGGELYIVCFVERALDSGIEGVRS